MRKTIITLATAALLAGCATTPPPTPIAASGRGQIAGFASIAQWGTWEAELAPAYTRAAALYHRNAARLEGGRISRATAIRAHDLVSQALDNLNASRRSLAPEPTPTQRAHLAEARSLLDRAAALLED